MEMGKRKPARYRSPTAHQDHHGNAQDPTGQQTGPKGEEALADLYTPGIGHEHQASDRRQLCEENEYTEQVGIEGQGDRDNIAEPPASGPRFVGEGREERVPGQTEQEEL